MLFDNSQTHMYIFGIGTPARWSAAFLCDVQTREWVTTDGLQSPKYWASSPSSLTRKEKLKILVHDTFWCTTQRENRHTPLNICTQNCHPKIWQIAFWGDYQISPICFQWVWVVQKVTNEKDILYIVLLCTLYMMPIPNTKLNKRLKSNYFSIYWHYYHHQNVSVPLSPVC